jgi:hypothetical protein
MFFSCYVADFSRTWGFLYAYQEAQATPKHLLLAIDAVSLAFLSHRLSSQAASGLSRSKYGAALHHYIRALNDPGVAYNRSTFESALLLDLFEKLTSCNNVTECNISSHMHGALSLVKLQGVDQFRDDASLKALMSISLNATIYSLSTRTYIPKIVQQIRRHASNFLDTSDPKWRLGNIVEEIANMQAQIHSTGLSAKSICEKVACLIGS